MSQPSKLFATFWWDNENAMLNLHMLFTEINHFTVIVTENIVKRNKSSHPDVTNPKSSLYGCESWTVKKAEHQKNWCFWTVVLEKTLESPLECKEIQPVHPKGDQSWVFIARTDAEAETPVLWPPHVKSWLIGKDPDAGRNWGQEEKGTTEDEMAGWHHQLNGHEFE